MNWLFILEHTAPYCNAYALLVLRPACLVLKQVAEASITSASRFPLPEVEYEKYEFGTDGEMVVRKFTTRELYTSREDYSDPRFDSICLEEGSCVACREFCPLSQTSAVLKSVVPSSYDSAVAAGRRSVWTSGSYHFDLPTFIVDWKKSLGN